MESVAVTGERPQWLAAGGSAGGVNGGQILISAGTQTERGGRREKKAVQVNSTFRWSEHLGGWCRCRGPGKGVGSPSGESEFEMSST